MKTFKWVFETAIADTFWQIDEEFNGCACAIINQMKMIEQETTFDLVKNEIS